MKNQTPDQISKRNRMFYNRKFMHINARDIPPSKAFCFIIEYTPYLRTKNDFSGDLFSGCFITFLQSDYDKLHISLLKIDGVLVVNYFDLS